MSALNNPLTADVFYGQIQPKKFKKSKGAAVTKSNFKKFSYDVISVTSSLIRHQKTSEDFSILSPSQSKFLVTLVKKRLIIIIRYMRRRALFPVEENSSTLRDLKFFSKMRPQLKFWFYTKAENLPKNLISENVL